MLRTISIHLALAAATLHTRHGTGPSSSVAQEQKDGTPRSSAGGDHEAKAVDDYQLQMQNFKNALNEDKVTFECGRRDFEVSCAGFKTDLIRELASVQRFENGRRGYTMPSGFFKKSRDHSEYTAEFVLPGGEMKVTITAQPLSAHTAQSNEKWNAERYDPMDSHRKAGSGSWSVVGVKVSEVDPELTDEERNLDAILMGAGLI